MPLKEKRLPFLRKTGIIKKLYRVVSATAVRLSKAEMRAIRYAGGRALCGRVP